MQRSQPRELAPLKEALIPRQTCMTAPDFHILAAVDKVGACSPRFFVI